MLKPLLGSENRERVLIFLLCRDEGYASQLARFYKTDLTPIQNQLQNMENGGVLISKRVGRTLLYMFNPRYPFLKELKQLLSKALEFYDKDQRESLLMNRRRPRKRGKPI